MIDSIVIQAAAADTEQLVSSLHQHCPRIRVRGVARSHDHALSLLRSLTPSLLFYDVDLDAPASDHFLDQVDRLDCRTILMAEQAVARPTYSHRSVTGLVRQPFQVADLVLAVRNAVRQLPGRSDTPVVPQGKVGIPTLDGFEYLDVQHILRCEGLQKCTRVVTTDRKDIISSYPIGAFRRLLAPYGFYDVHRSHLVNLRAVVRYTREGFIYLADQSRVPLARRKRNAFLALWEQL